MENCEHSVNLYLGNNKNKEYLIYCHIYSYIKKEISFGTIIGNPYPYYKYFSDNIYITYNEEILNDYLNNMNNIYLLEDGNIKKNILIVDSNHIDLNTNFWKYFLENHKKYNTTIFIVLDKINNRNIKNIKKYVNNTYIVNYKNNNFKYIYKIYKTFFKDIEKINYESDDEDLSQNDKSTCDLDLKYIKYMCNNLNDNMDIIYINKNLNNDVKIYKGYINIDVPLYNFDTYKIYDENKIYNKRCTLKDIINV
jgi:hypothetical protein